MAKTTFFGTNFPVPSDSFDYSLDYMYQNELYGTSDSNEVNSVIITKNNFTVNWEILSCLAFSC